MVENVLVSSSTTSLRSLRWQSCHHRLLAVKQFPHLHYSGQGLCLERHNTRTKLAQVLSLLWCNSTVSPMVAVLCVCIPQLSGSWVQAKIIMCLLPWWCVTKVFSYQLILHSNSCHHPKMLGMAQQSVAVGSASSSLHCHGADILALQCCFLPCLQVAA